MKRKNIISLLLALAMTVGCSMPGIVNAATDLNGNSMGSVTPQEVSEPSAQNVNVNATVASTFSVSVPKTIQLDGSKKSASYKVTCSGDFPANKKVTVLPAVDVVLSSVNKDNVIAAITQDKTEWLYDDHTEGTGTITADTITAGIWNGVFDFTITFEDTECPENEHNWEYQTKTEEKQELVKNEWDEIIKAEYDEEVKKDVNICNGCGMEFSEVDYDGFEAALDALTIHAYTECDMNTGKQGYHTETRTITIHHNAEIVHHPAEYKTVTVETKVSRTCRKCQKHQERAEFENELQ